MLMFAPKEMLFCSLLLATPLCMTGLFCLHQLCPNRRYLFSSPYMFWYSEMT